MFKKLIGFLSFIMGFCFVMVGQAAASTSIVDVSGVTVDTTMLGTVGALIAAGLGGLWGWRKFVKSVNRS